jgi:hypothetical protein
VDFLPTRKEGVRASGRNASATPTAKHKPGVLLAVVVVPLVFAITLSTFAWPSARLEPRDLPLGLAGPAAAIQPVEQRLEQGGNAFELHRYANEQEARGAIEDREVYGAIVASVDGPTLLTSSAASPLVAGLLQQGFAELQSPAGKESEGALAPVDVVPADPDDPRGSVLSSLVLPLVLSAVIAAVLLTLTGRPGLAQTGALLAASLLAGLVGIGMVQGWLGALGGPWLVNACVLSLTVVAIASFIVGLTGLIGHAGLALGALLMILVGNPWSGISSAPELLPEPIGLIGQLLPPGAGGNLLRSTASFDGAGAAGHLTVLFVWVVVGLGAMWAAALFHRRRAATTPQALEPALR